MTERAALDLVSRRSLVRHPGTSADLKRDLRAIEAGLAGVTGSEGTRIEETMRHELLAGGKRLRPMLTCAVMRTLGRDPGPFMDAVTAVELAHTGSLLHDDIIDGARTRRGRLAGHVAFDVPTAILAGDHLVVRALERLARGGPRRLLVGLCTAIQELCAGVSLEREMLFDLTIDAAQARRINRLKTASLFAYAAEAGAILAEAVPRVRRAARTFGLALGEAFQTTDDLLDLCGKPAMMGKAVGQDLTSGAVTVPLAIALERAPELRDEVRDIWRRAQDGVEVRTELHRLRDRMERVGALDVTRRLARRDVARATGALGPLPLGPWREQLRTVARAVVGRET